MRLDEWQKYIDSQFLDEEAEPAPAPAPVSAAAKEAKPEAKSIENAVKVEAARPETLLNATTDAETATQTALFAANSENADADTSVKAGEDKAVEASVPDVSILSKSAPIVIPHMLTVVVAPPSSPTLPPAGRAPRIEILTPLPETTPEPKPVPSVTEEVANRTRRRRQSAEASPVPNPAPILEPVSERIAPTESRLLSPASRSSEPMIEEPTAAGMPPAPVREAVTPKLGLFEPITDMDSDIPVFQRYLPSSHAAAMPAEPPAISREYIPAAQADIPDMAESDVQDDSAEMMDDLPADLSSERARRAPKSRARHARNVRPENVHSGLSASELWAAVPRHVQTLLSLERLEEKEVAQFSYKRPFQEKRHELIERLLDPILSLEDTARLLNVCPTTVRRYTNKGILTYYRKEPERSLRNESETAVVNEKETRQRRFRLSDILAFLETQQSAIESDRQAEQQAERRRLARAVNVSTAYSVEPETVSDAPHPAKDS